MDIRSFFANKSQNPTQEKLIPRQEELIPRQRIKTQIVQPLVNQPSIQVRVYDPIFHQIIIQSQTVRPPYDPPSESRSSRPQNNINYINPTGILFDDKFKQFVDNLIETDPNGCISALKIAHTTDDNIKYLMKAQDIIRHYFKTKYPSHRFDYPDYFAVVVATASDLSKCNSWYDVGQQFVESATKGITYCANPEDFESKRHDYACLCSHWCSRKSLSIILNKHTDLSILVACDCITKTGIVTKSQFKKGAIEQANQVQIERDRIETERKWKEYRDQIEREKIEKERNEREQIKRIRQKMLINKFINIVNQYNSVIKQKLKQCADCPIRCIEKWATTKIRCIPCFKKHSRGL